MREVVSRFIRISVFPSVFGVFLHDIHHGLLTKYDYKDSDPPPAQPVSKVRPVFDSQDGVSHQETDPLFLPQLDHLYESNLWGEDASKVTIPTQKTLTH